jgi:hypothetical protein
MSDCSEESSGPIKGKEIDWLRSLASQEGIWNTLSYSWSVVLDIKHRMDKYDIPILHSTDEFILKYSRTPII